MATSMAVQSIFATSVKSNVKQLYSAKYFPKNARFGVRCMTQGEPEMEKPAGLDATPPTVAPPPQPKPSPPRTPKMSTKFSDILAFSGPAPERINGRLAMIGFVAAIGVELSKGQDVFSQLSNGGIPWFIATSVVLSAASLIPLFQGVTVDSKSKGLMTSDAEMWNGRFAMLGLIALAFTEYVKGSTLV